MSDAFKFLSPREFQKLSAAGKERYLSALFEHLHPEPEPLRKGAEITRKPKQACTSDDKD